MIFVLINLYLDPILNQYNLSKIIDLPKICTYPLPTSPNNLPQTPLTPKYINSSKP